MTIAGRFTAIGALPAHAPVTVYNLGTTTATALYATKNGTTTVPNPISTDGFGTLAFFAVPGDYDIVFDTSTLQRLVTISVPTDPTSSPGALLALVSYAPATQATFSSSSKTLAAMTTTNLAVTFTAPPSGRVIVRLSAKATSTGSTGTWWGLLDATTGNLYGSADMAFGGNNSTVPASIPFVITSLTPGTVYTMNWALARGGTVSLARTYAHTMGKTVNGTTGGPAKMEVIAG